MSKPVLFLSAATTDPAAKPTIRAAAAHRGVSLSRFVVEAALREAHNVLREKMEGGK